MDNPLFLKLIIVNRQLHNAIKAINIISYHKSTGMYKKNKDIILVLERLRENLLEEESAFNDLYLFQERMDSANIKASEHKNVMGMSFMVFFN